METVHLSFRWETAHRYYKVVIRQDLFQEWQLVRCWGERGAQKGQQCVEPMLDYAAAERRLRRIAKERTRLGYHLTTSPILLEAYGLSSLIEAETQMKKSEAL